MVSSELKQRYNTLDILRALAIIAMVIYHTLWDLVYVFSVDIPWFYSKSAGVFQLSIRWSFILISGFCWQLGSRKIRRALIVLSGAVIIYASTALFMSDGIMHGILTLIGLSALISVPLQKLFLKFPPFLGLFICFLLFFITYDVELGRLGAGSLVICRLPDFLYANNITAVFGFCPRDFFSSDYVPLFPWMFLYWSGIFIFSIFKKYDLLKFLSSLKCPPLEWLGRHSLIIYLAHQPIIYGVLYLIFGI